MYDDNMKKDEKRTNTMGSRIKEARESKGISQAELAEKLGFQSATAVSLIESGERGIAAPLLLRISEILKRDFKYFLGQKEDFVDVQVALRADKDLSDEDKDAIERFITLAKQRKDAR
jgi:transcriptional regulator with XRE-family HTH domain